MGLMAAGNGDEQVDGEESHFPRIVYAEVMMSLDRRNAGVDVTIRHCMKRGE